MDIYYRAKERNQNNQPMKGAFQMLDGENNFIVEGNLSLFI
jgi:hypothetical protein